MLTQKDFTFAIRSVMGNFLGDQMGLNWENGSNLNKKKFWPYLNFGLTAGFIDAESRLLRFGGRLDGFLRDPNTPIC